MIFEVCKQENILVVGEPLGSVFGYYENFSGQPIIHINERIENKQGIIFCLLLSYFKSPNEPKFITLEQYEHILNTYKPLFYAASKCCSRCS